MLPEKMTFEHSLEGIWERANGHVGEIIWLEKKALKGLAGLEEQQGSWCGQTSREEGSPERERPPSAAECGGDYGFLGSNGKK